MSRKVEIVIEEIDYHRNGIGGVGFHVVLFSQPDEKRRMMAVVFPLERGCTGNGSVASGWNGIVSVFDRSKLAHDNIRFGENSWRGDQYERPLREAIEAYSANDHKPVTEGPYAWRTSALVRGR